MPTNQQDAMEAAARAVQKIARVDSFGDAIVNSDDTALACVTAYLAAMRDAGFAMTPVNASINHPLAADGESKFPNLRAMLAATPASSDDK